MLQQVKWKLARSLYGIVGRDPPARPQAEAASRPRRTVRFLGKDVKLPSLSSWRCGPCSRWPFTATLGAILLLASLYYFGIIPTKGGWAERADHFKAFLAWFLGGIFLLVTSKVLDPLVGTNLGHSLRDHFGHWNQHAKLIVDLGAVALASIAALVLPFKKG